MAVRIRSLMIAAGRLEHWAAHGHCAKEQTGGSSAVQSQNLKLQLVGCEMADSECTDINIALASLMPRNERLEIASVGATSAAGVQAADGRGDIAGYCSHSMVAAMSDTENGDRRGGGSTGVIRPGWAD